MPASTPRRPLCGARCSSMLRAGRSSCESRRLVSLCYAARRYISPSATAPPRSAAPSSQPSVRQRRHCIAAAGFFELHIRALALHAAVIDIFEQQKRPIEVSKTGDAARESEMRSPRWPRRASAAREERRVILPRRPVPENANMPRYHRQFASTATSNDLFATPENARSPMAEPERVAAAERRYEPPSPPSRRMKASPGIAFKRHCSALTPRTAYRMPISKPQSLGATTGSRNVSGRIAHCRYRTTATTVLKKTA